MSLEGGCLCGAVRYTVAGAPSASIVCHCRSCRKAAAAPSMAWLTFPRSAFAVTAGSPTHYTSSPGVTRAFCAGCGTPLLYESEAEPDTLDITTVSLDDPAAFPPTREVWLDHRLPWAAVDSRRGQYPTGTGEGPAAASDGGAA